MSLFADRVRDTTLSTGVGSIVLANSAPVGYQTFAGGFGSSSAEVAYCIAGASEWEVGLGTFNGTTGLSRDQVTASSNAGSSVNFSAGTKDVFCTVPAASAGPEDLAAFDDEIDLSFPGFGATMPETTIAADTTLTVKTGSRTGGYMEFVAVGDGSHGLNAGTNFHIIGGAFDLTEGACTLVQLRRIRGGGSPDQFVALLTPLPALPATAVLWEGPGSGATGSDSAPFVASLNGSRLGNTTVTPEDAADGGAWDPTDAVINDDNPTASFAYSAASDGTKTLSITNDAGLDDPDPISYVASGGSGVSDDFSGTWPARSDGGSWTLIDGSAPSNSGGRLIPGAGEGGIVADFGQDGVYTVVLKTTVGTFTPFMRMFSDGSTTNYVGVAVSDASGAFAIEVFAHVSGTFLLIGDSSGPVFTSGVDAEIEITVTLAPDATQLHFKKDGVDIPGLSPIGGGSLWTATGLGGVKTGPTVPASGITFASFDAH